MVRMNYCCKSCGLAFAHEPEAQIHVLDCHGGTDYESLDEVEG